MISFLPSLGHWMVWLRKSKSQGELVACKQIEGKTTAATTMQTLHTPRCLLKSRVYPTRKAACTASKKIAWICTDSKDVLLAALESGFHTAVFNSVQKAAESKQYASFERLVIGELVNYAHMSMQVISDADTKSEVARLYHVHGPDDLKRLEANAAAHPTSLGSCIIMDASDWQIIPAENLVALLQSSPSARLMAMVNSADDAMIMLGALQVGTHGVVLRTESAEQVRDLAKKMKELESQRLTLELATVTTVKPVGLGDRVCVDLTCMLTAGEGLLAGSFARGLFLVHSECAESAYIASRPFRVNAGAVHAYVLAPNGKTAYLSELRSGSNVQVVAPDGTTRTACVGRCKLESRPMVLIEAQAADCSSHSVILQNAETVKLVGCTAKPCLSSGSGKVPTSVSDAAAEKRQAAQNTQAISVASLQPGDKVLIHRPQGRARHTGIAIDEWLVEQ